MRGGRMLTTYQWMKVLSENPKCAPWMRDLLAVIGTSLLVVNPEARMSATQLAQTLKQMQDWGRSHPGYFTQGTAEGERMVVLPILLEHEEPESSIPGGVQHRKEIASDEANLESPAQTVESPPFTVQLMGMKQLPCSAKRHRQSMLDKLRLSVEGYLDEVIDWWPLRPLDLQKEQHTELRWEVSIKKTFLARKLYMAYTSYLSVRWRRHVDHSE